MVQLSGLPDETAVSPMSVSDKCSECGIRFREGEPFIMHETLLGSRRHKDCPQPPS